MPPQLDRNTLPPMAVQLLDAESHARRAALVIRLPDAMVLSLGAVLQLVCRASGFAPGADFLDFRIAALHAVRGLDGELPEQHRRTLETWRRGLIAVTGGEK